LKIGGVKMPEDTFYPYTILYINYDFYKLLTKEDFWMSYRNHLIIATFRTLSRIIENIEEDITWKRK
jgi:hypothetical protein